MATHLPISLGAHGTVGSDASPARVAPRASAGRRCGLSPASVIARAAAVLTWLIATAASLPPVLLVLLIGLVLALG